MSKFLIPFRALLLIPLVAGILFPSLAGVAYMGAVSASPSSPPGVPAVSDFSAQAAPSAPNLLDIPLSKTVPTVDGNCQEYAEASVQTFVDGNGSLATVYLMHTGGLLYVCMTAQHGTFPERFASLYLDPQGDGSSYTFAQKDDFSLRIGIGVPGRSSYRGSGVSNGYVEDSSLTDLWAGAAQVSGGGEVVEYSVPEGRFFLNPCQYFGLAVYHHWFSAVGDDYGWPSNQWFDQPRTWQLARLASPACADVRGHIAYVFRGNTSAAISFYNLLTGAGYGVTLVPLGNVLSTDFSLFDLTIIADDTGDLDHWGIPALTATQVDKIKTPNKPIIGLGEGGYAFFGRLSLFIGWPMGWHGPQFSWNKAGGAPPAYYTGIAADPVTVYSAPVNSVGIYLGGGGPPSDVFPVALETPSKDHAALIQQNCKLLWGGSGNPLSMASDGVTLFLNAVGYMRTFQCPPVTPPPPNCVEITKTASPASGTPLAPGDVIQYTVTYHYSNDPACNNATAGKIIDTVPPDTFFVPGSASDGISPGADGSLVWTIPPDSATHTKTFKVEVAESQCKNQRTVNNRAGILNGANPPVISNVVSHPVNCPPVHLPNDDPPFAEGEINIYPYPLILGHPSDIQVKVTNSSAMNQPVNVAFQTSPDKFGIGLSFMTFDSKTAVIPAHSSIILHASFTPASSGHYCIQIVVTGPGLNKPLVTQRNIDVTEQLQPGVADTLTFKVGNPTAAIADVVLVVDNTCPAWTAAITSPAGGVLAGMAPGEVRNAVLTVTPPNPVTLGTTCHIDVQGWIGDHMIGGIRKLDVPPVQLPPGVNPPWEEPEISVIPDPPVAGSPAQICVELQNPLNVARNVNLDFAVADFGAGIPFTVVGNKAVTLPPNSIAKYCINWTPSSSGTLHQCIQVILHQDGYPDQRSQRNIDLVRIPHRDLSQLDIPFVVFNPDLVDHQLVIMTTVFGIIPEWAPHFIINPGDPPPDVIMGGETLNLHLKFAMPIATAAQAPAALPLNYGFGDVHKVEVTILMDGAPVGGFTVQIDTPQVFLPVVMRK